MTTVVRLTRNRFPELTDALRAEVSTAVRTTAFLIEAAIVEGMTAPHSGRTYGQHQASAPGEMPAVDTSTLLGSLNVDAKPGDTTATVYVSTDYALALEYGAPGANILPRPYMTPAAEAQRDNFARELARVESRLR